MASPVEYQQVAGTAIYEVPRGDELAGWAAYVLPGSALPAVITAGDAFTRLNGHYLFAVARPAELDSDPAGFAKRALEYFAKVTTVRAVAWLASAAPATFGPFASHGFQFIKPALGDRQLTSNLNARFGAINFFVLISLRITLDEATGALRLSIPRGNNAVQQYIGFQRGSSDIGITVSPGNTQQAWIPVTGANTGCFVFTAELQSAVAFSARGIPVGCRYVVRAQPTTLSRQVLTDGGDRELDYPVLDVGGLPARLAAVGVVDLSDPFNRALGPAALAGGAVRTAFGLAGTAGLASFLRTATGKPLALLPIGVDPAVAALPLAAGALAFASASPIDTAVADSIVYLAPAGRHGVIAGDPASRAELLCGLFGSERLGLQTSVTGAAPGDVLRWLPSQPAYAPVFPFATAALDQPDSGDVRPRLDPRYLTSWVTIVGATAPAAYHAEPEGSPLFGDPTTGVLRATPPSLAVSGAPAHSFPLAIYAGVRASADVTADLYTGVESEILAPTRRTRITEGAAPTWAARARARAMIAAPATTTTSTTPQGLLVTIDPATGAYQNVLLAQSTTADNTLLPFAFEQPTIAMQQALQTNQLFVVAVNPAPFVDPAVGAAFANVADLAGWTMTANVGAGATPTAYKNVVLFKYCAGSLADRVTNPNRWTDPQIFSLLPDSDDALAYTGLSQWLQDYLAAAIELADSGTSAAPFYRAFKAIATDPDWNGVIVLAADLAAGDLPPQIQGLAAGIDLTRFASHHFGFTASRVIVDPETGALRLDGPSSWFGLVDYTDLTYAANVLSGGDPDLPIPYPTSGDYGFTVLELRSLFENTALTRFESRIQLTVDRLFASRTLAAYRAGAIMPATAVVLLGSYIDQGGDGVYVFEQTTPSELTTDSNALSAVAFTRVQFNTLGPRDGGATIASRFLIWGAFDFAELHTGDDKLLDVMSFGSPDATPAAALGAGLAFSNLVIDMTFPITTPSATVFVLDTANLAYDLNASAPRPDSLFRGFALQLKSFVAVTDTTTPAALGFLSVSSSLALQRLTAPWYGVVYEVTLGGPGALAAAAGYTSNLLVAWSAKSTRTDATRAMFLGLSLPGAAPGAKLFSIEGVFKVAVGAIALERQRVPSTGQDPPPPPRDYYCLRLDDIAVKIFSIVKLPPAATIRFFLFGDPDRTGSLGWYAAYVADPKAQVLPAAHKELQP